MADQSNKLFKQVFESLSDADKQTFVSVLDQQDSDEKKNELVNRLITSYNEANTEGLVSERQAALQPGALGPVTSIPEALTREEATFANPILQAIRQAKGPVFGQDPNNKPLDTAEAFRQGLSGESVSPYRQGQQVSYGDVAQELGVPEDYAPAAGLLMSQALPSSLLISGAGRKAVEVSAKAFSKAIKGILPSVDSSSASKIEPLFRNTFRLTQLKAGTGTKATAEILGNFSGVHPDHIVSAIENPKWLDFRYAGEGKLGDFASQLRKAVVTKRDLQPSAFGPSPEDINLIADNISTSFKNKVKEVGQRVGELSSREGRTVPTGVLDNLINIARKDFGVIDDAGEIRGVAKNGDLDKFFNGVIDKTHALALENNGRMTANSIRELNGIIREEMSKTQMLGPNGIPVPMEKVEAAATKLKGQLSNLFHTTYGDNVDLISAYDEYANLTGIRGEASALFKSKDRLAEFIRNFDTKSPTAQDKLSAILAELPEGSVIKKQIEQALNTKANTLQETFPFLASRNENDIESGFKSFMKRDLESLTDAESEAFIKISKELGFNVEELIKNKISTAFQRNLNIFKAHAAAQTLGASTIGYAVGGGFGAGIGFGAGLAASSPKAIAGGIKFYEKYKQLKGSNIGKTARAVKSAVAPNIASAAFRKFIEGDNNG